MQCPLGLFFNKTFLKMFKKHFEQTEGQPVQILGRKVEKFLADNEIKSLYVRTASHFGSTQFVQFKKVS